MQTKVLTKKNKHQKSFWEMESLVLSVCCRLLLGVQSRVGCQRQFLMMLQHLLILHRNYHQCVRGKDGFQKMATFLSLFIFSVLTSFSFNFNFSPQIKSLFIFNVLTRFFVSGCGCGEKRRIQSPLWYLGSGHHCHRTSGASTSNVRFAPYASSVPYVQERL